MVAARRPSWKLISFVVVKAAHVSVYVLSVADRCFEDIFIGLCTVPSYSGSCRHVVWLNIATVCGSAVLVCSSCSVSVCRLSVECRLFVVLQGRVQVSGTGCSAHVPCVSRISHVTAGLGLPSTRWWSV